MPKQIVPNKQEIEITIIRDGHFYLYSRYVGGKGDPVGKVITRDRALQIHQNNQDGAVVRRSGRVDFDEQPCGWEWTVRPAPEPDPEEAHV